MNIFKRFWGWIKRKIFPGTLTADKERKLRRSWLPRWARGDYTLRNSELVFAAVSRISNALSAMPVQQYRASTPMNSDLNDIISFSPNENMTSCQFFKTLEACRCTYGNAYAIKKFNPDGTFRGLEILDPTRIMPVLETDSGELWYKIKDENKKEYYLHGYYIIHVPFISTNGYQGICPVDVLTDTLQYNIEIQKYSVSQLSRGVNAQIVLQAPTNLGEAQKKEMIDSFMQTYHETSGNILLLESGVSADTLKLSPINPEAFSAEKISRSKVAMVYNIPPHLMGDYSDASFSSQEQQMIEFMTLTMLPIVTAYEQELTRKLISKKERKEGIHFKFAIESILRADSATRAEVHQKAIRGGWMTPNEVRREYGLPNDSAGKKLLVSRDLIPLDYLLAHPSKTEERKE